MPRLRLTVLAIPGEIAPARAAISEFCQQAGIRGQVVDDVRLAVSEACTNCVLHASPEAGKATFTLEARLESRALLVVVSDDGVGLEGMRESSGGGGLELGGGLRLIAHLATGVDIVSRRGSGTRVCMRFLLDSD